MFEAFFLSGVPGQNFIECRSKGSVSLLGDKISNTGRSLAGQSDGIQLSGGEREAYFLWKRTRLRPSSLAR